MMRDRVKFVNYNAREYYHWVNIKVRDVIKKNQNQATLSNTPHSS